MPAPNPDRTTSFSAVDAFTTCERRFYYERVLDEPQEEGAPLVVGNVYHSVIAALIRSNWQADANAVAATYVEGSKAELKAAGARVDGLVDEVVANMQRLRSTLFPPYGLETVMIDTNEAFVERKFRRLDLGFGGVIDYVSDRFPVTDGKGQVTGFKPGRCVLDWKTLSGDRRRSDRDARFSPQLGLYKITVPGAIGAGFVEIPRDLGKPIVVRMAEHNERDTEMMRTWLVAMRATILKRGTDIENYRMTDRDNPLCSAAYCPKYFKCYPMPDGPKPV